MYNNPYSDVEHDSQSYTSVDNPNAKQLSHAASTSLGYSEEGLIKPQPDKNYSQYHFERPELEAALSDVPHSTSALEPLDFSDSDPLNPAPPGSTSKTAQIWSKLTGEGNGRYPLSQRIENKRRGIGRQRYPFITWALTLVMVAIFIYESVVNWKAQGTPFSFKPVVNPMLGPSTSALINLGARFVPCMKQIEGLPTDISYPCLNDTANPATSLCPLSDVCGFGGFHGEPPNQWFRFITPIFLHAGLIHLALNMFAQLSVSAQVERELGSIAYFILYFAAGIFGNVLGANFALLGSPSIGASGAIFGTIAVEWIDLIFHWKLLFRPLRRLIFLVIDLIIGVILGYVSFVDNFAHLGGLFMGLLIAMIFYPIINTTRQRRYITWALRIIAIPVPIILFVLLIRNFYTGNPYSACSGCRFLSCFPTNANDHCHKTGLTVNGVPFEN